MTSDCPSSTIHFIELLNKGSGGTVEFAHKRHQRRFVKSGIQEKAALSVLPRINQREQSTAHEAGSTKIREILKKLR